MSTTSDAETLRPSSAPALERTGLRPMFGTEASWVTVAIAGFLIWLPLQTTIALVAFQYGGLSAEAARMLLLAKDVFVAGLLVVLLVRHRHELDIRRYDWFAITYLVVIGLYIVVPRLLGSDIPLMAVAASARILVLPVELYALGRVAVIAGIPVRFVIQVFLVASAVAAAIAIVLYVAAPPNFWATAFDLPRFVHEVQGYPGALDLTQISVVVTYGLGTGGEYVRATWPFTHPVGTGHYFVVPAILAVAGAFDAQRRHVRPATLAVWLGAVVLFLTAAIIPLSRGAWIATIVAALVCGFGFGVRRLAVAVACIAAVLFLLVSIPPFRFSVLAALGLSDPSIIGHGEAIAEGSDLVLRNLLGLGVGNGDHPGMAFGEGETQGAGESTYLSLLVAVGPMGLLTIGAWAMGIGITLWRAYRSRDDWVALGLASCLVGLAVSSLTAAPLMRFTTAASYWLLIGLIVASGPSWRLDLSRVRGKFGPTKAKQLGH